MNASKRPGPVTAVAVLCFVLGGGGLISSLCGLGMLGLFGYLVAHPPAVQPGQPDVAKLLDKVDSAAPAFKYYMMTASVATFVFCLLEVVAGIGLLQMRYWGRQL